MSALNDYITIRDAMDNVVYTGAAQVQTRRTSQDTDRDLGIADNYVKVRVYNRPSVVYKVGMRGMWTRREVPLRMDVVETPVSSDRDLYVDIPMLVETGISS